MRVLFIGTGAIGLPTLRALREWPEHELIAIVTQPDKPAGRSQRITAPPVKEAGGGVPILQPARIKDAVAEIAAFGPDAIIVVAYGQILPRAVLEIPRLACLNVHASLLPRWRGAAPIQAAIVAGDRTTGVTVMYMDAGLDTGDILLERSIEIRAGETGATLHDRLAQLAPEALHDALAFLGAGDAPRLPQDEGAATYSPKLQRDHGRIDWSESAEVIERKIRAYDPWPGAFTCISAGERPAQPLKIFRARIVPETGRPGSILQVDGEIVIGTAEAALQLEEVQPAGKRRMRATAFARGLTSPLRLAA